ncbi:class I SAM-dependent methyltransferase [Fundidesulfovibrio putealis]|uniref:methyltransferase n=1 Tax=Fundidesulfovibrio putealis TaxID=270496 RepID=UPI00040D6C36|nr:methyltransferase [Fundidesulfovibrio putealis]
MTSDPRILELALDPASRLDDILALARSRYPVVFETVSLGGMDIDLLQIEDLPGYIDRLVETARPGEKIVLPFWAKLWPASFPLAMLAARTTPSPGKRLLELGAGLGLCGLAAAKKGIDSLITDIEPEALLFIRASILRNGLDAVARAGLLDMGAARLDDSFDVIVASEALYLPLLHEPLADFLVSHLKPGQDSHVLLSCDRCREAAPFFARVQQDFLIQRTQSTCRSDSGESQTCVLYRMRSRTNA